MNVSDGLLSGGAWMVLTGAWPGAAGAMVLAVSGIAAVFRAARHNEAKLMLGFQA